MNKRIPVLTVFTASAVLFLFAFCFTGRVFAGSMLTSPPGHVSDGLIIIDDKNDSEVNDSEILFINLRSKMDKVFVSDSFRNKLAENEQPMQMDDDSSKYPAIMVACRPNTPALSSTSDRYRHSYSSRSGNTRAGYAQLNITPIIFREAKKNDISPLLLKAVIHTESNFNTFAVSPAGAMGLCQLMPGTARSLGVTDPFDPEQSIMGGAKYLGQMKRMFGGSFELMLAAYNAGPGAVKRAGGVPNFRETRNYIVKVKNNMKW
jgi:hypothetical protein